MSGSTFERGDRQHGALLGGLEQAANACGQGYSEPPYVRTTVDVRATASFGEALMAMRGGQKITRRGWNASDQWVAVHHPLKGAFISVPFACLKNSRGDMVPWVPSQGDMFAEDWAILPG